MDEVAVFPEKDGMDRSLLNNQPDSPATITEENNFVIFLKYQQPFDRGLLLSKLSSLRTVQKVKQVSPVFYTSNKKHPATRMALTGEIIVQYPPKYTQNQISVIEKEYGLERLKAFGFSRNAFLYRAGNPLDSLDIANWLNESGEVNYAYPNWLSPSSTVRWLKGGF